MNQHIIKAVADNAHTVTYTGASSAILFWGLHVSDIAAIISTACAVCGLMLQVYVVKQRRRLGK